MILNQYSQSGNLPKMNNQAGRGSHTTVGMGLFIHLLLFFNGIHEGFAVRIRRFIKQWDTSTTLSNRIKANFCI